MATEENKKHEESKKHEETTAEKVERLKLENLELEQRNLIEELEAKKYEKERRNLDIQKLKQDLAKEKLVEMQRTQEREAQGRTFSQDTAQDQFRYKKCTHKKGGVVSARDMAALFFGGNKEQYAVLKHQMINQDIWVRCLRCGRTWKPPVEKDFYFRDGKSVAPKDGVFDKAKFEAVKVEYELAVAFPTGNSMSGSVQCRLSQLNKETGRMEDASEIYRENVRASDLR
jgi:hypothetical protein